MVLLFLDTETTGLPKSSINAADKWPRVVQLAWALYDTDGTIVNRNSFIIYPVDFTIPRSAAKIHGITTERAKKEGTSLHNVLPQFNADAKKAATVVAHNLAFDLPIVNTEFLRCGLETNLNEKQQFCTMRDPGIVSWCRLPAKSGTRYKWPTLTELHRQVFGTEFSGSHDAGADVEACARCYFVLKERGVIG